MPITCLCLINDSRVMVFKDLAPLSFMEFNAIYSKSKGINSFTISHSLLS